MAQSAAPAHEQTLKRAERTWLLPTNRKLRNLVSISLRNISLTPTSPTRKRGKTTDDDALPQTLRSPAKLVALREQNALGISRSSTDLRALAEEAMVDSVVEDKQSAHGSPVACKQRERPNSTAGISPKRPQFRKARRRSTIEWANSTPQRRQERLADVAKDRMADVFFSLHVRDVEEPVYVSETVEQTMNPTFRYVDWTDCGPGIVRQDQLMLRVWVKVGKVEAWRQLLELNLHFTGLQYLGKSLHTLDRALPENAVILHMLDGLYTAYTNSLSDFAPSRSAHVSNSSTTSQRPFPTCSFDALLRLAKLDDSIQDALATRDQIANELEALLQANKQTLDEADELVETEDRLKTIEFAKRTVEKQLEKARKQQLEKRASLTARRKLMTDDLAGRDGEQASMDQARPEFPTARESHEVKKRAIQNQRRRICEELQLCYPVEQLTGKMLAFTIRDLHLPNSENLDSEPPENLAAAFGYIAHVLQLLSFYLARPLPYPVTPCGSTSTIFDGLSILKTNTPVKTDGAERTLRTYPLFTKSVPRFRFEYAVFLVNQNIHVLLESAFNLRVLDIRQTLPNLKYLLYVATAGEGELPARKAGGIRGLMRAPALSRGGSADSTSSRLSGLTLFANGHAREGSRPGGAVERLRELSGKVT